MLDLIKALLGEDSLTYNLYYTEELQGNGLGKVLRIPWKKVRLPTRPRMMETLNCTRLEYFTNACPITRDKRDNPSLMEPKIAKNQEINQTNP